MGPSDEMLDRRHHNPGRRDPLNAKPTAGPRRAVPPPRPHPPNPPHKAAHTATGGASGRNRSRSPVMVADVGLNGARRRPSGMDYSQTMPSLSASRMWG